MRHARRAAHHAPCTPCNAPCAMHAVQRTMLSLSPPIKSSDRSASCATPDAVPTAADASLLLRMRRAALAFSFAFSSLIRDL
eukprot:339772-Chlamydomonas_euryale.AAC.1